MNALMVDDQYIVVQGVIDEVNWPKLGVRKVFSAYSVEEACAILQNNEIHILLCDIELPPRSGFEILEWIQKRRMPTQCIFLSAHAEFEYARTAVKMNSFDYILQPARYEDIEEVIAKAIVKIREARQLRDEVQYGRYWKQNEKLLLSGCLISFFGNDGEDVSGLLENLNSLGIGLREESAITPILIQALNESELGGTRQELCHTLQRRIGELLRREENSFFVADMQEDGVFAALYDGDAEWAEITGQLRELLEYCRERDGIELACYVGEALGIDRVHEEYHRLKRCGQNNVAGYSGIFLPSQTRMLNQYKYEFPYMQRWSDGLIAGEYEVVLAEVLGFLQSQRDSSGLDAAFLAQFHQDFIQMFFTVVKRYDEDSRGIFYGEYPFENYLDAYTSYEKMVALIHFTVDYIRQRIKAPQARLSPVQKAEDLIRRNIERNFTCAEIAESVFLNPNYLSRLFKKEKGMSLNEYIITEKMQVACSLMRDTSIPVSLVASKVGYSNFSYFSQVFRKHTGMAPVEFRQQQK